MSECPQRLPDTANLVQGAYDLTTKLSRQRRHPSKGRKESARKVRKKTPAAPSFRGLRPSTPTASLVGKGNKAHRTKPELILRRGLTAVGIRCQTSGRTLPGRPDAVWPREKLVVFCDGDFWHGRAWSQRRSRLEIGANADYWVAKISRNRMRDRAVNRALNQLGWRVVRLWESDIIRDEIGLARQIRDLLRTPRPTVIQERKSTSVFRLSSKANS